MSTIGAKYNSKFTWEMKLKLMGMPGFKSAKMAVDEMKLPITPEEFLAEAKQLKERLFPECKLLPGAEKLVKHLKESDVPIALASGSIAADFNTKTRKHKEFFAQFEHFVLGDDPELKHGKPFPDVFLITASRFGDNPDPSEVLVFEDSPNGITAAVAAGMGAVLVPDPRLTSQYFNGATSVISSLEEFKPEEYGFVAYA